MVRKKKSTPNEVAKELIINVNEEQPLLMIMDTTHQYGDNPCKTTRLHLQDEPGIVKALQDHALSTAEPRSTLDFIYKTIEVLKGARRLIKYQVKKRVEEN